jgi:hypothetical protein
MTRLPLLTPQFGRVLGLALGGLAALAAIGFLAPPPGSAAQGDEPAAVVQAMHEAWNAYDETRVLASFADDATVTTPTGDRLTARHFAARARFYDPFINRRLDADEYRASNSTVGWVLRRPSDVLTGLGIQPAYGTAEAVVEGGKIRSYVYRTDPAWQVQFEAAQAAALQIGPPPVPDPSLPPARLATTLEQGAQWDLYAVNLDGSGLVRLTNTPEREVRPTWSPDGARLAFSVGKPLAPGVPPFTDNLYVVSSDGTELRQLVRGPLFGWVWSPDSRLLAYVTGEGSNGLLCAYATVTTHVLEVASGQELTSIPQAAFPVWLGASGELVVVGGSGASSWAQAVAPDSHVARPLAVPNQWIPFTATPAGDRLVWDTAAAGQELVLTDAQGQNRTSLGMRTVPLRTLFTEVSGCRPHRDHIRAWAPDGARLVVMGLDLAALDPQQGADPANMPLNILTLDVLNLNGAPAREARIEYPTLLSAFTGVFKQAALPEFSRRGMLESDLGIVNVAWSGDGTRLLYAVADRYGSVWRFFWHDPADGSRGEMLGGLDPESKAFFACCGR